MFPAVCVGLEEGGIKPIPTSPYALIMPRPMASDVSVRPYGPCMPQTAMRVGASCEDSCTPQAHAWSGSCDSSERLCMPQTPMRGGVSCDGPCTPQIPICASMPTHLATSFPWGAAAA